MEVTEQQGVAGVSVMVVDDHPMWRDGVSRDLEAAGFIVAATADGVERARNRAAAVTPDVVLMDMHLPDGNGADATAAVLEVSPHSKILVLSASSERDDVLDAIKAGASGYLVKSASVDELLGAVRATYDGQAVFTLALPDWYSVNTDACPPPPPTTVHPRSRSSPNGRPKCCDWSRKGSAPSRLRPGSR